MSTAKRNVRSLKEPAAFRAYLDSLGLALPFDDDVQSGPDSPLAQPLSVHDRTIGNRFAILPMEGWDNTTDGKPTDLTRRRWRRWGQSGAKLIFGAEAMAVCPGRPRQPRAAHDDRGEPRGDPRAAGAPRPQSRGALLDRGGPVRRRAAHPLGPRRAPEQLGPAGATDPVPPSDPGPEIRRRGRRRCS